MSFNRNSRSEMESAKPILSLSDRQYSTDQESAKQKKQTTLSSTSNVDVFLKPQSQHGNLLWVNHDAKNMEALPHRQRVFSHVQNSYRKWKRRKDNQALRASVKLSLGPVDASGSYKSDDCPNTQVATIHSTMHTSNRSQSSDSNIKSRLLQAPVQGTVRHAASPLSIMQNGDSDPFDCFAIKITPIVNDLLSFYRDKVFFAMFHKSTHDSLTKNTAKGMWQQLVDGLEDAGCSYGLLACAASIASRTAKTPIFHSYATAFRQKSIVNLRQKLANPRNFYEPFLLWHLNTACVAEIYDDNLEGAHAHSQWIRHQFEKRLQAGPPSTDMIVRLNQFLYNDVQIATLSLTRTAFDVRKWIPNAVAPIIQMALQFLPSFVHNISDQFNSSVTNEDLRATFLLARKFTAVWLMNMSDDLPFSDLFMFYSIINSWIVIGQLIDHYLTSKELAVLVTDKPDDIYAQQYLALGALYWCWSLGHEINVCGMPIFDGAKLLLPRLRNILEVSERPINHPCWTMYKEARLFATFAGALAEQRQRFRYPDPSRSWFNQQLARQSSAMGLSSWLEVEAVLETFTYDSRVPPCGSVWFQDTLDAYLRSDSLRNLSTEP